MMQKKQTKGSQVKLSLYLVRVFLHQK